MRTAHPSLALATLLLASVAHGQGLLSLQNGLDRPQAEEPMSYNVYMGGGYDRLDYSRSDFGDIDTMFLQGGVGANFANIDRTTPWNLGVDLSSMYYFDAPQQVDEISYMARTSFNISHEASERLRFSDNFFLTYEIEPNFGVGASTARRNGQYLYGFNNFSVAYAWSERFSTTTSYTVDGIRYDDSAIGDLEDRFSHTISQQFSYAVSKTMKSVLEYRYRTTQYRQATGADFASHFLLAGVDKAWSERSTGSFRAGAELYESERASNTAPYVEAAVSHAASDKTNVQVFASVGYDGSELRNYGSRYSYRTGANATHHVSERLRVNGGMNYVYSEFEGVEGAQTINEHQINATAGLGYRLWNNVNLDANYTYTLLASEDDFRDYDRNRIYLGLNAAF
jgi:hypothetical protein